MSLTITGQDRPHDHGWVSAIECGGGLFLSFAARRSTARRQAKLTHTQTVSARGPTSTFKRVTHLAYRRRGGETWFAGDVDDAACHRDKTGRWWWVICPAVPGAAEVAHRLDHEVKGIRRKEYDRLKRAEEAVVGTVPVPRALLADPVSQYWPAFRLMYNRESAELLAHGRTHHPLTEAEQTKLIARAHTYAHLRVRNSEGRATASPQARVYHFEAL